MKTLTNLARFATLLLVALVAIPLSAGSQRLSPEELAALQNKALTHEDHLKLSAHYAAEAEAFEQEAQVHQTMANRFRQSAQPPKIAILESGMTQHCKRLSRSLKEAAKQARQLSESHKAMAAATEK